jgi:hypothetical protein
MAETKSDTVFLRNKQMLNVIEVPRSEYDNPKKWGDAEKEIYEEVDSEEDRNRAAWEQVVKDSKRHDKEVKSNEDLQEAGVATADAPARPASPDTADTKGK